MGKREKEGKQKCLVEDVSKISLHRDTSLLRKAKTAKDFILLTFLGKRNLQNYLRVEWVGRSIGKSWEFIRYGRGKEEKSFYHSYLVRTQRKHRG